MKAYSRFTRPADTTAYTANDAVANNTTAGSVTPLSFGMAFNHGAITQVRVRKTDQSVSTPTIRVWLYAASPTPGAGDNAAFAHPIAESLNFVDVSVVNAGSDDAAGWTPCYRPYSAGTVYALLQAITAFTPASEEVFQVDIWYEQT